VSQTATRIVLAPQTAEAFDTYIREAEAAMEATLSGGTFLWSDLNPRRSKEVREGQIVAQFWAGQGAVQVPNGLIHDWIGAAFIPGATLEDTLRLIQDYDNRKTIYTPEVIDSKLVSRMGNDFQIYLRLLKKKIITVVLDTDHDVRYRAIDRTRWICHSRTTRIAEVENAGSAKETVLPPDTGHGFLWRLYSYWRFEEESGVYVECRAISLTRDVPVWHGMDDRTDHPKAPEGVPHQDPGGYSPSAGEMSRSAAPVPFLAPGLPATF
jgi:hypothetical protein